MLEPVPSVQPGGVQEVAVEELEACAVGCPGGGACAAERGDRGPQRREDFPSVQWQRGVEALQALAQGAGVGARVERGHGVVGEAGDEQGEEAGDGEVAGEGGTTTLTVAGVAEAGHPGR